MVDISFDFTIFENNPKYAIICRNKFEVIHCVKALYAKYPEIKIMTAKRFGRIAMGFCMPVAITPNLHKLGYGTGYGRPEYYESNGFQVVEFTDMIAKDITESDIAIEDFLGLTGG